MKVKLTAKQEAFTHAYGKMMNASAAYRKVYDTKRMTSKSVNESASHLLKNPKVAARISEIVGKASEVAVIEIKKTLREIAKIAYVDLGNICDARGIPLRLNEMDEDTRGAIASYKVTTTTTGSGPTAQVRVTYKIKLWDKLKALDMAMRYHGLYERDNNQATNAVARYFGVPGKTN